MNCTARTRRYAGVSCARPLRPEAGPKIAAASGACAQSVRPKECEEALGGFRVQRGARTWRGEVFPTTHFHMDIAACPRARTSARARAALRRGRPCGGETRLLATATTAATAATAAMAAIWFSQLGKGREKKTWASWSRARRASVQRTET